MWLKQFKKFLIRLLMDKEIEKDLIDRRIATYFDDEGMKFDAKETEELWRRIGKKEPLLLKWITSRQNFLLKQSWIDDKHNSELRAIVTEWEVIKRLIESKEEGRQVFTQEKPQIPNIQQIKKELKKMAVINSENQNG
jgi:predicted ABC-class ATPase